MKAVVFITAGLGDAVLLIPLIKALRNSGRHVTGVFQSCFVSEAVFEGSGLLDDSVLLTNTFIAKNYNAFDEAYVNHLAASPRNLLMARFISKRILSNFAGQRRQWLLKGANRRVNQPLPGIHDALQNLRLLQPEASSLDADAMAYAPDKISQRFTNPLPAAIASKLSEPYVALQVCAANNLFQYKTWPQESWIVWLKLASHHYPNIQWILLGEPSERQVANTIVSQNIPRVISLAGETSLSQVMQLIWGSQLLVGLDSGLMHLAVAFGRPTFTLWGGSDPTLYGYEWLDGLRHRTVSAKLPCGPCNSWIKPNTSRVGDPLHCPDFACMRQLHPQEVFRQFQNYYTSLGG